MILFWRRMGLIGGFCWICPKMHILRSLFRLGFKVYSCWNSWRRKSSVRCFLLLVRILLCCLSLSLSLQRFGAIFKGRLNPYRRIFSLSGTLRNVKWAKISKLWKAYALTSNLFRYFSNTIKSSQRWLLSSSSLSFYWLLF